MSKSRNRTLGGVVGVAVLALAAGLYTGSRLTSPSDAAARASAPQPTPVTVEVERRELHDNVVGRGDASYAGAVEVRLDLGGVQRPVVTGQVPKAGDKVHEGDVLLEVVGRPVIALKGVLPMYRSLRPGLSGPDVEQLEETLARLGFAPGVVDGEFDKNTSAAVERLYDSVGYPAPKTTSESEPGGENRPTGLPASEIFYVRSLPRQVDEVNVKRGGVVSGPVMSVSGAKLLVTVPVDDAAGKLVRKGMSATLELPSGGKVDGKVTSVSRKGSDGYRVKLRPKGLSKAQRKELLSANVRAVIPVRSSKGKVLTVPLSALSAAADGASRVQVSADGKLREVTVEVGMTASGYAEVRPAKGQSLRAGDLVVVSKGEQS